MQQTVPVTFQDPCMSEKCRELECKLINDKEDEGIFSNWYGHLKTKEGGEDIHLTSLATAGAERKYQLFIS